MYWNKDENGDWLLHVGRRNAPSIRRGGDGFAVYFISKSENGWELRESMNMWAGWIYIATYRTLAEAKRVAKTRV